MTLIIDNYDSFTFNLAQLFMRLGEEVRVVRNDEAELDDPEALDFDRLVISPGPGRPEAAGKSMALIRHFSGKKPILGVCLGHQAIAAAFGGTIVRAGRIMHGKADAIEHDGKTIFSEAPNPLRVIRYHSLAIERASLPSCLEVSATSPDGEIMAVRHRELRIEGLQFHPESIGTEAGERLVRNFLSGVRELPSAKSLLKRLSARENLGRAEARSLMDQIADGGITQSQIGAILASITLKGATIDEVTGFAEALRARAVPLPLPAGMRTVDNCGTGGDSSGTFNISTTAAFVVAGSGAKVAKHGNRSITSKSGSADVLEALGIPTSLSPARAVKAIEEAGMAFLFAPAYHPAFRNIMGPRRELGFRTVFNMMGPLLNPARATSQVIGVYSAELTETVAKILDNLGSEHALVVHGLEGIDEISLVGKTRITELRGGWMRTFEFDPADYGFEACSAADLKGGNAAQNAEITLRVLSGEPGPKRDVVIVNAAAAILAADLAADFPAAIETARCSLDSGKAMAVLETLRAFAREDSGPTGTKT
jgi:anthranilate synthase/phosphoribosyltransferase